MIKEIKSAFQNNAIKYKILYIILANATMGFLSFSDSGSLGLVTWGLFIIGACVDMFIPFCLWASMEILSISFDISIYALSTQMLVFLMSILAIFGNKKTLDKMGIKYLYALVLAISISFVFGKMLDWRRLFSIILLVGAMFASGVMFIKGKQSLMIVSLLSVGIVVAIISYYNMLNGLMLYSNDYRMTYNDNVRKLANAIAFPLFYVSCKVLHEIRKAKMIPSIIWIVIMLSLAYLLIMTYSRGVIIAILLSVSSILLFNKNKNRSYRISIIIFLFILIYAIQNVQIESDRMTDDQSSIARLDLWSYMIRGLTENPIRVLFGFGIVNMKELLYGSAFDGYYSHSVFLDYLFSTGLIGFVVLLTFLWSIIKKLYSYNEFYLGLFVLTVFMFVSHGDSTSVLYYALMGLCYGSSIKYLRGSNRL